MRYQTTTIILKPTWKIQVKIMMLYWRLMKESFNIKLIKEIPPIQMIEVLKAWHIPTLTGLKH